MRDVQLCRGEHDVSREVLTKRRCILGTTETRAKTQTARDFRGQDRLSWTMSARWIVQIKSKVYKYRHWSLSTEEHVSIEHDGT
jgi:hypothetical protein